MKARRLLSVLALVGSLLSACAVPGSTKAGSASYDVGDRIDPATRVLNSDMQEVRLWDRVGPDSRVVVLILFGGGAAAIPPGPFRGPLWCVDSFDDLSIQRALVHRFEKDERVRFLAVAVAPVYSPARYGYPEGAFSMLSAPATRDQGETVRRFIHVTLGLQRDSLLPYPEIFFDPGLGMLRRGVGSREEPWQGRFKWRRDSRKYGVPTVWVLSGEGRVLCEPFWGNDYGSVPPQIRYGFSDLAAAVERGLGDEH